MLQSKVFTHLLTRLQRYFSTMSVEFGIRSCLALPCPNDERLNYCRWPMRQTSVAPSPSQSLRLAAAKRDNGSDRKMCGGSLAYFASKVQLFFHRMKDRSQEGYDYSWEINTIRSEPPMAVDGMRSQARNLKHPERERENKRKWPCPILICVPFSSLFNSISSTPLPHRHLSLYCDNNSDNNTPSS